MAPTELYIVMAITVATFSWLLAPRNGGYELPGSVTYWACGFLVFQVTHIVYYSAIDGWWPTLNIFMHRLTLMTYVTGICGLLLAGWYRLKSSPPDVPVD